MEYRESKIDGLGKPGYVCPQCEQEMADAFRDALESVEHLKYIRHMERIKT
jgi:hypothetical protein